MDLKFAITAEHLAKWEEEFWAAARSSNIGGDYDRMVMFTFTAMFLQSQVRLYSGEPFVLDGQKDVKSKLKM